MHEVHIALIRRGPEELRDGATARESRCKEAESIK